MIRIEDLALSILTKTTVIPEFKSKDGDLNEFLMQEAKDYQEQLLAVTYLLQNPKTGDIVAYFSLLNDTIKFLTVDAYADAVSFYENKGGFKFFTETDVNDDTRLLYFDLKPFKDALETDT